MRSCLYEGSVVHVRRHPVEHRFRFPLLMPYLDLDELPGAFAASPFWSAERRAVASFRREDHFGDPAEPLAETVRDLVEAELGRRPEGSIGLLTHPRYFGYVFNPISLFYCWNASGDALEAVVAEVTSTPWGERHCYVLSGPAAAEAPLRSATAKALHVSPFMGMGLEHRFRISAPGERLRVTVENEDENGPFFTAALSLERRPWTSGQLARALWRYPLLTVQVQAAIHWHALRLWLRGVPFVPHPARPREVTPT